MPTALPIVCPTPPDTITPTNYSSACELCKCNATTNYAPIRKVYNYVVSIPVNPRAVQLVSLVIVTSLLTVSHTIPVIPLDFSSFDKSTVSMKCVEIPYTEATANYERISEECLYTIVTS